MNKNLFSRTAATSFVLGLAMAASAQQANFLSSNHCIYRVDNSQKVLLLPVQEKAEMCNVKVIDGNSQVRHSTSVSLPTTSTIMCRSTSASTRTARTSLSTFMSMAPIVTMVVFRASHAGRT